MKLVHYVGFVLIILLAVLLFVDAATLTLSPFDPVTGRGRGCYTTIESWIGLKQPSSWIRPTQAIFALSLIPLSLLAFLGRKKGR